MGEGDAGRLRKVAFGQELSTWPLLKVAHARGVWAQLQARVLEWMAGIPLRSFGEQSEDRREFAVKLEVREQPPVEEWSLLLGDVVHNLRAALDAFAWELSHLDGQKPPSESGVYFPVSWTEADFDAKVKALGPGAAVFGERMRQYQPFVLLSEELGSDRIPTLGILHALDLEEKHRGTLRAGALIGSAHAEMVLDKPEPDTQMVIEPNPDFAAIENGAPLAKVRFSRPVTVVGDVRLPVELNLQVHLAFRGYDANIPLVNLVDDLIRCVHESFDSTVEDRSGYQMIGEFPFEIPTGNNDGEPTQP